MIRKAIGVLALGVLFTSSAFAQTVNEGVKELNSYRPESAKAIFQKLSDKPEAQYWMFRTLLDEEKKAEAADFVTKALAAKPNEPFLLVAKGELALMDKKENEAKQLFESAVSGSTGRKGADPLVLNAIGRSIVTVYGDTKVGDLNYAIQKLETAVNSMKEEKEKNRNTWMLADTYINLGDAYRLAKPGEGSMAFANYQNAIAENSGYGKAVFRMAQIFKSQRNYSLFEEYLNKSITANPSYLPAYYELYEYKLGIADYAGAQKVAEKIVQNSPGDPNNEYYSAVSYFLNKQYDQAISTANAVIAKAGDHALPKTYKLIAYSYLDKKDTAKAVPFVDKYFAKVKKADIMPKDYTLKAMAYSVLSGKETDVYNSYLEGLKADTVLANRVDLLEEGAKFFAGRGQFTLAGDLYSKLIEIKPADKVTLNDYFNAGYYGYYRSKEYEKAWAIFDKMRIKFPSVNYGYLWTFRSSSIFDSSNAKNIMLPDAEKLIAFSKSDTAKDAKANILSSSYVVANYYNEIAKDKAKAVEYLTIARDFGTDDAAVKQQIQGNIEMLQKAASSSTKPANAKPATSGTKPKGKK